MIFLGDYSCAVIPTDNITEQHWRYYYCIIIMAKNRDVKPPSVPSKWWKKKIKNSCYKFDYVQFESSKFFHRIRTSMEKNVDWCTFCAMSGATIEPTIRFDKFKPETNVIICKFENKLRGGFFVFLMNPRINVT